MEPKSFMPGRLLSTPGVLEAVSSDRLFECLEAHLRGNWGDALGKEDWKLNTEATHTGARLLSSYWIDPQDHSAGRFWIITEAEGETEDGTGTLSRAATTIILPEEY